jgi:hypothetical protein
MGILDAEIAELESRPARKELSMKRILQEVLLFSNDSQLLPVRGTNQSVMDSMQDAEGPGKDLQDPERKLFEGLQDLFFVESTLVLVQFSHSFL